MGTQAAITRKMSNDNKFKEDIANELKLMEDTMGPFVVKFEPFVESLYTKNGWTGYKILGQSIKQDLQSEAAFSLKEITDLIKSTADSLVAGGIGGLLTAPKEDVEEAQPSANAVALGGSTEFMISAAVATITSVLNLFNSKASGQIEKGMESHRIAPGLMLHAYGFSSVSSADTSVEGASIVMSTIGYKLIWCAAQQSLEQDMTFMAFISDQLRQQEAALKTMRHTLLEMAKDPESDDTKIDRFKRRLADVSASIDSFRKKSDELVAKFSKGKLLAA